MVFLTQFIFVCDRTLGMTIESQVRFPVTLEQHIYLLPVASNQFNTRHCCCFTFEHCYLGRDVVYSYFGHR